MIIIITLTHAFNWPSFISDVPIQATTAPQTSIKLVIRSPTLWPLIWEISFALSRLTIRGAGESHRSHRLSHLIFIQSIFSNLAKLWRFLCCSHLRWLFLKIIFFHDHGQVGLLKPYHAFHARMNILLLLLLIRMHQRLLELLIEKFDLSFF